MMRWLWPIIVCLLVTSTRGRRQTLGSMLKNVAQFNEHVSPLLNSLRSLENISEVKEIIRASKISSSCEKNVDDYIDILTSLNFAGENAWALSMLDSTAMIPNGLLSGNLYHLGHFDECVAIRHPHKEFVGQHCMLNVNINVTDEILTLYYGICLPSTCTSDDINTLMADVLPGILNIATVNEQCSTDVDETLDTGSWVVIGFLAVVIGITTLCTLYHLFNYKDDFNSLAGVFSVINNCSTLFSTRTESGQMGSLNGLRAISMAWVVLGHTYENILPQATVNLAILPEFLDSIDHILIWNGIYAVDTFFFLSGLLVSFVFFRDLDRKGYFDVPVSYIHRYIRLSPAYAVVVLILATIFRYFGNGPLWYFNYKYTYDACNNNWWASLLYINNYYRPLERCPPPNWYLAVDMQLFWLSPLLLYPIYLWPKIGTAFLGLVTIGSAFLVFGIDQARDFYYTVELEAEGQFEVDYAPTHMRASPWLVGVALGVLLCFIKKRNKPIRLSKIMIIGGWLFSAGCCLGVLYGVVRFLGGAESTRAEVAAYLAFTRLGWGVGLAWVVFACVSGYGGFVNGFLSLPVFQPLAKLSYSVFLVHISLQNYRTGMLRTNTYASDLDTGYLFLGNYVLSNLLAILMYVLIEAPFSTLNKQYFNEWKILPFPKPKGEKPKATV